MNMSIAVDILLQNLRQKFRHSDVSETWNKHNVSELMPDLLKWVERENDIPLHIKACRFDQILKRHHDAIAILRKCSSQSDRALKALLHAERSMLNAEFMKSHGAESFVHTFYFYDIQSIENDAVIAERAMQRMQHGDPRVKDILGENGRAEIRSVLKEYEGRKYLTWRCQELLTPIFERARDIYAEDTLPLHITGSSSMGAGIYTKVFLKNKRTPSEECVVPAPTSFDGPNRASSAAVQFLDMNLQSLGVTFHASLGYMD